MKLETVDIEKLKPAEYNPRKIDKKSLAGLAKSLELFGYVEPIVWNEKTGNVVGGHQRLKVLREQGKKKIDVIKVDLDIEKEKALNVALNNQEIQGKWDKEKLLELLGEIEVNIGQENFKSLKFRDLKVNIPQKNFSLPVEKEVREDIPSRTQKGELWKLGNHFLYCGDCTNTKKMNRLLDDFEKKNNRKILMIITDPPYGVKYDATWRDGLGKQKGGRQRGAVKNDDKARWEAIWERQIQIVYVWHASTKSHLIITDLEKNNYEILYHIVWKKHHTVISRGDYHWQHESCMYAVQKGKPHCFTGHIAQSTVWEIENLNPFGAKQKENGKNKEQKYGHSTQKPLECMQRPIQNHGEEGDLVYEPFAGTGTTLIACENTKRKCFAVEIEPRYCDIVIFRWENLTGGKAVKC